MSAFLTVGLPLRTSSGLPRSASVSCDRVGRSLYSGVLVSSNMAEMHHVPSPIRLLLPSMAVIDDEASIGVHSRSPFRSFPRLWRCDGSALLGFSPGFAPRCYQRRTPGWEQASDTRLGLLPLHLLSQLSTHPKRLRVAHFQSSLPRTASAAWRSVRFSRNWKMVTSASRHGASAG
jgi:hypothetical protein